MRRAYKIASMLAVVIVVLGVMGVYINGSLRNLSNTVSQAIIGTSNVSLSGSVSQSGIFEYNGSRAFVAYSLVSYSASNALNASVSIDVYAKNPMQRIYLVNVSRFCISCFDENALRSSLLSDLISHNLIRNATSFSYISINNMSSIPPNSTVIIPSGLMPVSLMNDTAAGLFGLLGKGDVIVYVGLNFSKSIGPNGLIFVTPPNTLFNLTLSHLDTYSLPSGSSSNVTNMSFANPTFVFGSGLRYGNVTYTNSSGGTILALSNYPKSGWNSSNSMASDIAAVIDERFWMAHIGHYSSPINVSARQSGSIGAFASTLSKSDLNRLGMDINKTYSLVSISASNMNGSRRVELSFRNAFSERGSIGIPSFVGETQNIPLLINVNSNNPNTQFHLEIQDSNMSYISLIPVGFISNSFGVVKYYAFAIPSGYYLVSVLDFSNNVYARSFFYLENATIESTSMDFKNGTFSFYMSSGGLPVNNATYVADLNGGYVSGGSVQNGELTYSLPKGTIIGYGKESFNFRIFNTNYTYSTNYEQKVFNIPAIYIEFAVAILVVALLNLVLKPPNRDEYYIDVPEFPPSKKERVKVQLSEIVGVFDKVNYYYHWKYMPLTAEEVRSGIGNNIRINGMPVSITTQNTNTIIFTLMEEGTLQNASNYYAPSAWVETSGHSVEYLAIFRRIRDYCVSHAMLFTDLDAVDAADMFITKNSKQLSVLIYTTHSQMKRVTLSKDSRVAIVFLNDDVMRGFYDKLYSSVGKDVEILKLGIEYNYIKLIDAEHLDQLSL